MAEYKVVRLMTIPFTMTVDAEDPHEATDLALDFWKADNYNPEHEFWHNKVTVEYGNTSQDIKLDKQDLPRAVRPVWRKK